MPAPSQESAARRYRIEKYLTEGGMGAIYIGKKLGPGGFAKEVVLKQLLPEYTSRPEFRDLFFREAKISATLDHANIVHTFDLVESDQSLFIVMEYVRGADLRTIIRRARHRKRELSPAAAIHIALEILAGLGYAHARRDTTGKSLDIIHRDVSPSNIICSVQGAAKLSDFGIAKASTYSSVFYRVRGKVGYMSPEQARNQQIDHRCDLFSLSVCLYESLSGERLFIGDLNTPADDIYGIKIVPVSHKRPGLPPALDEVLTRALAPRVEDRYQSAAELAEALRNVAHRTGLTFSAPELATHLRDILGEDPERWLRDEPAAAVTDPLPLPSPLSLPAGTSELVGTEAASIGIVNDIAEDGPGQSVLSPSGVTGSKNFDLDSMLNDEATRPGGADSPDGAEVTRPATQSAPGVGEAEGRVVGSGTPPPVWTRDSRPFGVTTLPAAGAVAATGSQQTTLPLGSSSGRAAAPARLPGVPPAAAVVSGGRQLPRATIRSPAVPPPFQPRAGAAVPPAPPFPPATAQGAAGSGSGDGLAHDIEEATPTRATVGAGPLQFASAQAQPSSDDIEDALTPPPPAGPFPGRRPPPGAPVGFRGSPPAPYPLAAAQESAHPHPGIPQPVSGYASGPQPPLALHQPEIIDFKNAVTALLPEKKGGPPGWLAAFLILSAMAGGAALAHRVTRVDLAAALAATGGAVGPQVRSGSATSPTSPTLVPGEAPSAKQGAERSQVPDPNSASAPPGSAGDVAEGKPARPAARATEADETLDAPVPAAAVEQPPSSPKKAAAAPAARPSKSSKATASAKRQAAAKASATKRRRGKH